MDFQNLALKRQKRRRLWLGGSASVIVIAALAIGLARLGPALPTAQRANLWIGTVQRGELTIRVPASAWRRCWRGRSPRRMVAASR